MYKKCTERDEHIQFLDRCPGVANCPSSCYVGKLKLRPIDQMKELLAGATMSKFATIEQCKVFRDGVRACIEIMEAE